MDVFLAEHSAPSDLRTLEAKQASVQRDTCQHSEVSGDSSALEP